MVNSFGCAEALGEVSDVGFEVFLVLYFPFVALVEAKLLVTYLADFPFCTRIFVDDSHVVRHSAISASEVACISHVSLHKQPL